MSAAVFIVVGLVLLVLGTASLRIAVLAAGFGAGWLLAEALDASLAVRAIVAVLAALSVLVLTLLMSRVIFFVGGLCVGAVIGAKLFVVLDSGAGSGDPDVLLACVVVPAIAVLCGFLANHWERGFLRLGTAAAGAALVLSGVGRIGSDDTDQLWHPTSAADSTVLGLLWVALTAVGYQVQAQQGRR